jgi:uncharacterized protein involved in outer membrane biogenesis
MKKGFLIGSSIVGGLFVLTLVAPWLITLNQYKTLIQQKAFEATGRELAINGDVRFGILPSPYARLTDVVVKNPAGATSKDFATVKALDVGVALAPLFSKKVQVTHITVSEPAVTLEIMANGQNNWQFTPQEKTPEAAKEEPSTAASSSALSIDDFTIEKAYIRYIDVPKKSQQMVGPIDGTFKIDSLQGPISGKGSITVLNDLPIRFETTVDTLPSEANGVIPFKLALDVLNKSATADFNGSIQKGDDIAARLESAIAVPDLEKILGAISKDGKAPELPAYLKGKTVITGAIDYKDKQAKSSNLVIRAGGMEIAASLLADLQDKTSITLDLSNIVLPPELAQQAKASASAKSTSDTNLAETLEKSFASAAGLLDTAVPTSPLNIVVTAAQLPLPGQPILRDVRLAASSQASGITIQNVEAKLPGNTFFQLHGQLPANKDGKIDHATLNTKFSTQNMQAALGNEGATAASPISLQTTAILTRAELRLQPLQITQNNQTIQGDVVYTPKAADALVVDIKGSALDLDSLLGKSDAAPAASAKTETASKTSGDPLAKLQGLKARITADIGSLTYQNKTAKQVTLQANVSSKGLSLPQARIGDLGGMVITANGKIDRLSPLSGAEFNAQAKTPSLSQTLKALGNSAAENLGASQFDVTANGNADNLKIALNGTIDQGKIAVNGTAKSLNTSPAFTGKIDVSHPETATIVRNFGGLKPVVNFGAFALQTNLTYGADTLKADDVVVKLGSAGTLQGHVNITPDNGTRKVDAALKADKLALAALMGDDTQTSSAAVDTSSANKADEGWSKEPINLSSLRNLNGSATVDVGELLYKKFIIKNFKTDLKFADNKLNFNAFKGNLFDAGSFSINGQLAPGAENQAHRGDFNITVDKTDAAKLFVALGSEPFKKGTLDMNQKIAFNGASPYALVSSLNGDGQLKITEGVVNGIDLDGLAAKLDRPNSLSDFSAIINQARAGGETAIGDVTIPVTIRNGVVQVQNTVIKTQKTELGLNGTVNLPPKQVNLNGQITFTEQRNLPALALNVTGPMSNPQKNFDTRSFTSFYAQKATEKLQEKVQDKLGKFLGIPKAETPAAATPATETPAAATPSTDNAPAGVPAPVAPTAPTAPAPTKAQSKDDAIKQLGGQMLNNLFGSQKQ